jgi:hypothetical protein
MYSAALFLSHLRDDITRGIGDHNDGTKEGATEKVELDEEGNLNIELREEEPPFLTG